MIRHSFEAIEIQFKLHHSSIGRTGKKLMKNANTPIAVIVFRNRGFVNR